MKRLVVFPTDPLINSYNKGEVKERYFNPDNTFHEIHVISLCDQEIEEEKVQHVAGKAKLKIHTAGPPRFWKWPVYFRYQDRVKKIVEKIQPQAIRAFNPEINGFLAVSIGKKLKIPTIKST